MGWSGLPRVDDARPLGDDDRELVAELRAVLDRYGALDRFGITLLHSHFDLEDNEILVETVDPESRVLTIQPVPEEKAAGEGELVPTSWRLDAPDGNPRVLTYCHRSGEFHAI
jgi:hypothetical protein